MSLTIGPIDLTIVAVYLAAVVLLGLWIGRGRQTLSDYLLGGRNIPWWVVLGSIVATETSTVTFLSIPGLAYDPHGGDLRFLQLALGYAVGRCLVVWLFLPHFFRGQLFSAYQVLHRRFGGTTRQIASLLFLITRTLADGLRLYLTAIVLEKMLGLSLPVSVAVMGAATIAYTLAGGMRSVVWNDCIQLVVYLAGAVLAAWVILDRLPGGWEQFVAFGQEHGKFQVFDFSWDLTQTYTFWAGLIGGAFLTLGTHGADQMMVQRYLSARSQRDAARALIVSGGVIVLQFALFLLLGVGLAAFYAEFPPSEAFGRNDEAFATFIVRHLPTGVVGVVLAAVFSAAMSTLSSSLNSSATAAVNDFYLPLRRTPPTDEHSVWISRVLTVLFGAAQIAVGIVGGQISATAMESVVNAVLAIAGFTTGIILGVFFLGVLTRRVSQRAALVGLVSGIAATSFVVFGVPRLWGFHLAWPWYTLVGSSATFLVGCAASLIWPERDIPETESVEI